MTVVRAAAAVPAVLALALAPLAGNARLVLVPACGGPAHMLVVPADPASPDPTGGDCAKACHGLTDRRGKPDAARKGCC